MVMPCASDCPNRRIGCHASCERYKEWRAEYIKRKEKNRCFVDVDDYITEGVYKRIKRRNLRG